MTEATELLITPLRKDFASLEHLLKQELVSNLELERYQEFVNSRMQRSNDFIISVKEMVELLDRRTEAKIANYLTVDDYHI